MWQTDLFTFVLKRENRRVHMVAFMDDNSRFIVGHGLHASASGAMVQEVFESAVANFGAPEEVLTDNGSQYHAWRGKSAFRKLLDKRGIRQIVARPRHPQTLGKVERFWGTLWRECVQQAIFLGIDDARERIGQFVGWYNFQRPHQGIKSSVPADRYFDAESAVRRTLEERVAANALELARNGEPRKPFYIVTQMGGKLTSVHGEQGKVVYTDGEGKREEVDLNAPGRREQPSAPIADAAPKDHPATAEDSVQRSPGESALDGVLEDLAEKWTEEDPPASGDASEEKGAE